MVNRFNIIAMVSMILIISIVFIPSTEALSVENFDPGVLGFFDALVTTSMRLFSGMQPNDLPCNDKRPGYCEAEAKWKQMTFFEQGRFIAYNSLNLTQDYKQAQADESNQLDLEKARIIRTQNNLRAKTSTVWKFISAILIITMDIVKTVFYLTITAITVWIFFIFIPLLFIRIRKVAIMNIVTGLEARRPRPKKPKKTRFVFTGTLQKQRPGTKKKKKK